MEDVKSIMNIGLIDDHICKSVKNQLIKAGLWIETTENSVCFTVRIKDENGDEKCYGQGNSYDVALKNSLLELQEQYWFKTI